MTSEKKNFSKRLNEALDDAGVPQKGMGRQSTLVKMLGISHRQAKKWLEGDEFPQTSKLVKMAALLNVRSNWLLLGQGEKFLDPGGDDSEDAQVYRHADELSKEAFEVASEWMKLPTAQRLAIRRVIQELSQIKV
jgi:transcriptional regulator with XRE-family HTH domain